MQETIPPQDDQRPDWLKSMAEKTWNLEMVISGAATYLTSFLPGLADQAFYYFLDNINIEQDPRKASLAMLAYSFAKVISWLLPAAFIIHFIMRAFWAGLVGLHTVYPAGIRYEHLPSTRKAAQELYRQAYGSLARYIQRLDSWCNQVFAVAFTIVLFSVGLSMMYLIIFGITEACIILWGEDKGRNYSIIILWGFMAAAFSIGIAASLSNRISKEKWPLLYRVISWMLLKGPGIILPFINKPLNYMNMAFSTNMPAKRYYSVLAISMMIVMGAALGVLFKTTITTAKHGQPYLFQRFFARNNTPFTLRAGHYDDTRSEGTRLPAISLPAEINSGPYLKVFVSYTKSMDQTLEKMCSLPTLPDSLPKIRRQWLADSLRADCFSKTLQLRVNDSLYAAEWLFYLHPYNQQPGVTTFLPTKSFREGRNLLSVHLPAAKKPDSLLLIDQVQFWFSRE